MWVHLQVDFSFYLTQYRTAIVFSLSYDFLSNILFSPAYFIVRLQNIMHIQNSCKLTVYVIDKASGQHWAISNSVFGKSKAIYEFSAVQGSVPQLRHFSRVNCSLLYMASSKPEGPLLASYVPVNRKAHCNCFVSRREQCLSKILIPLQPKLKRTVAS